MENNIIDILQELHQNAIDFAYEANSQRAFADARDGLKPGQRACLWEFYSKGYSSNKPHVKSAKVSGGVISSWWPHGDTAIYDTFARMSQPWINNIPEVHWHGANGNQIIGNAVASARYTEARLSEAAEEGMFIGMKKNPVPMIPNFSEDDEWPEVLPALFPRLLVNGCQGIGYTLANHWVCYNLNEVKDVIVKYLNENILDYETLYPDFPTGGIIINQPELKEICATGKGKVVLRAKTEVKGNSIFITELPYQVYVEPLIDDIKKLIENEEIKDIQEIYNKSDKNKLLIEIVCGNPFSTLQQLFKMTDLQKTYNPNQYALVGKTPKLLNLKDYLDIYIQHNLTCIQNEYKFDLAKAIARKEIVDGLIKALENIDNIIALIKKSDSSAHAKEQLQSVYAFTENQAKAIVDMKLGRLAHLEYIELNKEKQELEKEIEYSTLVINSTDERKSIYLKRLIAFCNKFGTPRKTEVIYVAPPSKEDKEIEYVEPEKCVVIMTKSGLIKRVPSASFRTQKRNGKGVKSQDDIISCIIRTNTIDSLMVFSNEGNMYRLLVNDIPVGTNTSAGTSVKGLVPMLPSEKPELIYSIYRDTDAKYILFATKQGYLKKTTLEEYIQTKKKNGISALGLREGDALAAATLIKDEDILAISTNGMCIKITAADIPASGRSTLGVKGMNFNDGDSLLTILPIRNTNDALGIFTTIGSGKKIPLKEFITQKRGGKGVTIHKSSNIAGELAAAALISDEDQLLIAGSPSSICIAASDIPITSRTAIGNQLIKGSKITSVSKI